MRKMRAYGCCVMVALSVSVVQERKTKKKRKERAGMNVIGAYMSFTCRMFCCRTEIDKSTVTET